MARLEKFVALNVREALQLLAGSEPQKTKDKDNDSTTSRPGALFLETEEEVTDEGCTLPPLPFGFENRGAVAIIDVSGFTQLTTVLAQKFGEGGGAKIRSVINPVFSTLIDAVHRFNGSVVKFVGDALICSW
ncbi:hypothetical protein HK097_001096 [Rhizophlyctis rosea]|uniref:Guanylate cyclase domain-containing protein n=1 Tax=Rhizophlyctis rosea TaxID=64517 RepID=A0AAD5SH56_9FUNG|nr:hypothetical protein HK097_001096 [Rhizophlyctis rosea]